jgi:hypothetical protein
MTARTITTASAAALALALALIACAGGEPPPSDTAPPPVEAGAPPVSSAPPASAPVPQPTRPPLEQSPARPDWLGTRVLELAADGFGVRLATPPELVDRRFPPPPAHASLPVPPADGSFASSISTVDALTAARSTWRPDCPVTIDELRHVIITFVGFDERTHTGDLIVHRDVARDVTEVFRQLHLARFPLEEVRIITSEELVLPPTGDGNVTSAFVCRPTVGGNRWSEHAYGRAIDINPFHNPYVRGDLVLPELAGAYVERDVIRPGMVGSDGIVVAAFTAAGWRWGGDWSSSADWMHFSTSGR